MADDDDDWKYAVDEFEGEDDDDAASTDGRATDVFGENTSRNIEPGSPTFENTLFVLLGVAIALLVVLGI